MIKIMTMDIIFNEFLIFFFFVKNDFKGLYIDLKIFDNRVNACFLSILGRDFFKRYKVKIDSD